MSARHSLLLCVEHIFSKLDIERTHSNVTNFLLYGSKRFSKDENRSFMKATMKYITGQFSD